jgi:HlyD family secretion protein
MASRRKGLVALGIVAAVVLIVVVGSLSHRDSGPLVQVSKVRVHTVRASILAGGVLSYLDPVELKPEVIGRITEIPVKEGQRVHAGEVVLRLDPQIYAAAVKQAQASVLQSQTLIDSQKLTVLNLKRQVARQRALYQRGMVDANSFENLQSQYEIAREQLASQRQAERIAQARLNQAQQNLAKTVIRSPIDGVVTRLPVKVGETVTAGTNILGSTLMNIANPAQIIAKLQVDEADIANIKLGAKADIHAVSFPQDKLSGKVIFIASSVTQATTATAQANGARNFEVKVALQGKDLPHILPGMSCRAEIFTRSAPHALAVPVQAVLYDNTPGKSGLDTSSGAYVYVVRNGKAHKTVVVTGLSSDTWQAIDKGLKAGDEVVSGPYQTLHGLGDGQAVHSEPAKSHGAKGKSQAGASVKTSAS